MAMPRPESAFPGREENQMKGYNTEQGYMGYVDGDYILFASESDYIEYIRENEAA